MKTHWIFARIQAGAWLITALLLSACASKPLPPDWQSHAFAALKGFSAAYLSGNTRLADFEFARAKFEIASTGRADLMARAELTRCALRVASLEFDNCAGYQPLAPDAHPEEQTYAAFLTGQWTGLDATRLPLQYRAIALTALTPPAPVAQRNGIETMQDPLARLIAAGALLQSRRLSAHDVASAVDTASSQGWRRPLLAWLGVQLQAARESDDQPAATRIQRRIDLVLQDARLTNALVNEAIAPSR